MDKPVFFCAVGGSGMLPLALILKARGQQVRGSDRSYDQGRTPERFAFIKKQGIELYPQDGAGVTTEVGRVVVSTAVEKTVPDYQAALANNIPVVSRAQQLAEIFNQAELSLAVAGTSGKSTTTGMLGWLLHQAGRKPTIMNGAVMKNFIAPDMPFASAVVGDPNLFVSEVDESDGSIDLFAPSIALINNIALDHKSMEELRGLFMRFAQKARKVVINFDNAEAAALAAVLPKDAVLSYGIDCAQASLCASQVKAEPAGSSFVLTEKETGQSAFVRLQVPGLHNISNALAAVGGARAAGMGFAEAVAALESFTGIKRRLELVGTRGGVTVIDDFAHNPDKIKASLRSLHLAEGRLLVLFQPHGYGPLRLMRGDFVKCFADELHADDLLFMPDPLYLGGTADRSVTSADLVRDMEVLGRHAFYAPLREDCVRALLNEVRAGDRIVVMGARDDSLSVLAEEMLEKAASVRQ